MNIAMLYYQLQPGEGGGGGGLAPSVACLSTQSNAPPNYYHSHAPLKKITAQLSKSLALIIHFGR